ncbi:pci domain-containing [Trichoderma arundinaceum]|uniref:Pci domain-containing n=1 Tax=Trichoderma arundinaceum TaxID=490622 RepID=A0A395NCN3_TRIAR|nr:pci domain-containing [Trichoderma arundinaceum]
MRSSAIFVAIAAAVVSAQVPTYKSSLNMTIDPGSVPQQQRAVWCQAQTNTCQVLCDNNPEQNDCTQGTSADQYSSQATLTYDCTCSSNSSAPGLQYYTQTLPTFICQQLYASCIQANAGNQDGQDDCKNNIQKLCATRNPPTLAEISSQDSVSTTAAETTKAPTTHATTTAEHAASSTATSTSSSALAAATLGPAGSGAFAMAAAGLMAYVL